MKKYVASSVIDHTLSILAKDPQRNLVTLTRILELFAGGEKEKQQIQMARKAFEDPNHIWTRLAERGFSLISEDFRTRGLVNLFINEAYMGQQVAATCGKGTSTVYQLYRHLFVIQPDYADFKHGLYRIL